MKKILNILSAVALTLGFTACHESVVGPEEVKDNGSVSLRSLSVDVNNAEKIIESRAQIDLSDFVVQIYSTTGVKVKEWRYADMPELFELPVGDYRAFVYSHEVQPAEWEMPYFEGEKEFSITAGQITEIGAVICKLANIKVSIRYNDDLRNYMGEDCKVKVIANDKGVLEFGKDEGRAGYFAALPGSSTLVAEFQGTVGGNAETLRRVITDVEAGQHRIITFKLKSGHPSNPGETGGVDPGIGVDCDVEDENLNGNVSVEEDNLGNNDRPWSGEEPEEPEPGPGPDEPVDEPTITITSDDVDFDKINDIKDRVLVKIDSQDGIEHLNVTISTTDPNFEDAVSDLLPLSFDLAYPGSNAADFKGLGFPVGDEVIGAHHIDFDISQFVPLLSAFPGTHSFQISVTDSKNKQLVKTLTFKAE